MKLETKVHLCLGAWGATVALLAVFVSWQVFAETKQANIKHENIEYSKMNATQQNEYRVLKKLGLLQSIN